MLDVSIFALIILHLVTLHSPLLFQCSGAINQLSKGRNKDEESSELQALAAEVLTKEYKRQAPGKLPLVAEMLKTLKLS
jgi:hypothetical protein